MIKKSLLAACLLAVMPTLGMAADGGTAPAAPAASVANTNSYALDDQVVVTSIVIKFKEGTDITVEGGVLKTMGGMVPPPGVQVADITDGLNAIDKMLAGSNLTIERAFGSYSTFGLLPTTAYLPPGKISCFCPPVFSKTLSTTFCTSLKSCVLSEAIKSINLSLFRTLDDATSFPAGSNTTQ